MMSFYTSPLLLTPPTVYWNSRGGVGGIQVFSQQSTVMNLQTLFLRIQFFPNYQHITVVQVMHHLHHTWSSSCRQLTPRQKNLLIMSLQGFKKQNYLQHNITHKAGVTQEQPNNTDSLSTHIHQSCLPSLLCWWCEALWRVPHPVDPAGHRQAWRVD